MPTPPTPLLASAAMMPATAVPWISDGIGSWASSMGASGTAPARSGLVRSMPLSITATVAGASWSTGKRVRVAECVDRGEVPLARRQRVGRRPGQRSPANAQLRRERSEEAAGTAPAHAPAPSVRADREPERAIGTRLCARNPGPAAADHVLQCDEAERPLREQATMQPRARATAEHEPRVADHGHGRRRQRARDEAIARRLADGAPERDGPVVCHGMRGDVAPAGAPTALQRRPHREERCP